MNWLENCGLWLGGGGGELQRGAASFWDSSGSFLIIILVLE